jgi:Tht1-like nuclear fusion protein
LLLISTGFPFVLNDSAESADLVMFLNSRTQRQDRIFSEAIQWLESMKSSPSCNRIATTRMLASCQSIGGSGDSPPTDASIILDRVKSLYAARLAICELTSAGAAIPPACSALYVSPDQAPIALRSVDVGNLAPESDSIPSTRLDSCLKSLESRPQWWTSYSNSRQNAVVICQAARIEVEKEEMLEIHRLLAKNVAKLNLGLHDVLRNAAAESTRHKAFVEIADMMRTNLVRELEESSSKAQSLFSSFLNEIEKAIAFVVKGVMSLLRDVQVDTEKLGKVRV